MSDLLAGMCTPRPCNAMLDPAAINADLIMVPWAMLIVSGER